MMEVRFRLHNPRLDAYETPLRAALSELAALRAENEALAHVVELCRAAIGHNAKCTCPGPGEFVGMREGDNPKCMRCIAAAALLSTPAADLSAHDAKVREPLEERIAELESQENGYIACLVSRVEALDALVNDARPYGTIGDRYRALPVTPSGYLEQHDARIRREEREAAAKKCAEAYWAMVAPKDHAAMHPTIEFWRDALGLEPMSSAEHEALAAIEPRHPEIVMVDELAALVRLLVHSIRKHSPDNETARRAMDYLKRHELQGSPLRTTILSPAPDAAKPNNQQEEP